MPIAHDSADEIGSYAAHATAERAAEPGRDTARCPYCQQFAPIVTHTHTHTCPSPTFPPAAGPAALPSARPDPDW